jgi:hypothetical protein
MNRQSIDPRLVWLASVLAAATLVVYLAYQAQGPYSIRIPSRAKL